jgi:hypothetical protein
VPYVGPDPDDKLDEKFVDGSGSFKLKGFTRELSDIDPVLYIWTDCNDGNTVPFTFHTFNHFYSFKKIYFI